MSAMFAAASGKYLDRRSVLLAIGSLCLAPKVGAALSRIVRWNPKWPTPSLRLDSIDGQPWDLTALRGKVAVLNFWATWCEPCLSEMPQLSALARRYEHEESLVVLGINHGEGEAAILRFTKGKSLGFPILRDPDGSAFRAWQGKVLPTTILVGRDGRARYLVQGELNWDGKEAADLLQGLLAERQPQ